MEVDTVKKLMREHIPNFNRPEPKIIGTASDERKTELQKEIVENFRENRAQISEENLKKLALVEYPKQDFEKQAIEEVNHLLNEILDRCGVSPFDIKEENIYIVPTKTLREAYGSEDAPIAFSTTEQQSIVLDAEKLTSPLQRCALLAHEMIHLKSFYSIETAGERKDWPRRFGLEIQSSDKKDNEIGSFREFDGLNEAIVSTLEKQFLAQLVEKIPALKEEWDAMFGSPEGIERRRTLARGAGVAEDDIFWMEKDTQEGKTTGYKPQRKVLDYIIDTILRKHPERFSSQDDVFQLFIQAHFGGQLLPLARIIKTTFGEDAFRVLGMMSHEGSNSARLTMDYFQKKGGRVLMKESSETGDEHHRKTESQSSP